MTTTETESSAPKVYIIGLWEFHSEIDDWTHLQARKKKQRGYT